MDEKSKQETLSMSWIASQTRLPEKSGRYLVWTDKIEIAGFNVNAGKWKSENPLVPPFEIHEHVTHWMHCPKRPR